MRRYGVIYIILGILLLITLLSFAYLISKTPQLSPLGFSPPIPLNCSEQSIKDLWDYIFHESSEGIRIMTNNNQLNQGGCDSYGALKLIEDFPSITGGRILKVIGIVNQSETTSDDKVELEDVQSNLIFRSNINTEGEGTLDIGGHIYTIKYSAPPVYPLENYTEIQENFFIFQPDNNPPQEFRTTRQRASRNSYIVIGNPLPVFNGRILQAIITNRTTGYSSDVVILRDNNIGVDYTAVITNEGEGTITLDGTTYNIKYNGVPSGARIYDNFVEISIGPNLIQKVFYNAYFVIFNELPSNNNYNVYLLQGGKKKDSQNSIIPNTHFINALHLDATFSLMEIINYVQNINDLKNAIENNIDNEAEVQNNLRSRNIPKESVNLLFTRIFKIMPSAVENWGITEDPQSTKYYFNEAENTLSTSELLLETVNANYSVESLAFSLLPINSCQPNWTVTNNSCSQNEVYNVWYIDTNLCNLQPPQEYANRTVGCDFDRNNLIGNESSIRETNLNIYVYIDYVLLNSSRKYNQTRIIQIKEGNITRVEFSHNFNEMPLDLNNIRIEKQPNSSSFGYLIVEGIADNKKITIDLLNRTSSQVCVKDAEVMNIEVFSQRCNEETETLLNCPETKDGFTCNITSSRFLISGLTHSAAREISTFISRPTCIPRWNCVSFSECSNNIRRRVCQDVNRCGTNINKPNETETCTSNIICTPEWGCTNWEPKECPEDEIQTRICTDKKNCDTPLGKPLESRSCSLKNKSSSLIRLTIITALSISIIIIIISIIYIIKRKDKNNGIFNSSNLSNFQHVYSSRRY